MLPGEYRYPEELYCAACDLDVPPTIERRDALVTPIDGGPEIHFQYRAALCPHCLKLLCDRDYQYQFINAINGGSK